jgi:hypothetical protein
MSLVLMVPCSAQVVRTEVVGIDQPSPIQGSGHFANADQKAGGVTAPAVAASTTTTYTDAYGSSHVITTPQTGGETPAAWIKRHVDAVKAMQEAFPPAQVTP